MANPTAASKGLTNLAVRRLHQELHQVLERIKLRRPDREWRFWRSSDKSKVKDAKDLIDKKIGAINGDVQKLEDIIKKIQTGEKDDDIVEHQKGMEILSRIIFIIDQIRQAVDLLNDYRVIMGRKLQSRYERRKADLELLTELGIAIQDLVPIIR